jgi:Flp pilus assembly protein TadG
MRRILASDRGQTLGVVAIAATALIGMTGFVLDVGSWFRADRHLQAVADAAALAGAQELPEDPGKATGKATQYIVKNGGPSTKTISFTTVTLTNDTITVKLSDAVPGFFSRVFSVDTVTVGAEASAKASKAGSVRWVAPIVVNQKNKMLACTPPPCTGTVTLDYSDPLKGSGGPTAAGSWGFIDLGDNTGTGDDVLRDQIENGYDGDMSLGKYSSRTGNSFGALASAFDARIGDELLFPVYSTVVKNGTIATYTIVGWVGFVIESFDFNGDTNRFTGHFTRVTWEGLPAAGKGGADFGVRVISLTN